MLFDREFEYKNKKDAFSLVEIMVGLVVMSCVVTAFAPVITKKVSSAETTLIATGGVSALNSHCEDTFSEDCVLCNRNRACLICNKVCSATQFEDIPACNCVNCTDAYGANCINCEHTGCTNCNSSYYITTPTCTVCEAGYRCNGKERTICPAGTYATGTRNTSCTGEFMSRTREVCSQLIFSSSVKNYVRAVSASEVLSVAHGLLHPKDPKASSG